MRTNKQSLLNEKERNLKSIAYHNAHIKRLTSRNEEIEAEIVSIKNSEYGEILQEYNLEPEQLRILLDKLKRKEKTDEK